MKILILANFGVGLYKFRKELIEELISQNHEIYISLPNDEYVPKLQEIGCNFIDTSVDRRGTNPYKDLKLLLNYINIIKRINPDIVLTYTIKPNIYGGIACRITKRPYLANITGLGTAIERKGVIQKFLLMLYKIGIKKASCVFFQNEGNRQFFQKSKMVVKQCRLIPGSGVNLGQFNVLDYPKDNKVEFVFISRIMREKGIEQYIEASKYIKNKYPNTRFHICGFCEETYEDRLATLQEQGIIKYHGMLRDVRDILKVTHCTIHPSYYPEGISNVLLESAASGRPIITTNRSGCREVVDDGVNGYVVEQKNSKDLIEKIERFLALNYEEKKKMGLAGRRKVEKEFDRKLVVDTYMKEVNKF